MRMTTKDLNDPNVMFPLSTSARVGAKELAERQFVDHDDVADLKEFMGTSGPATVDVFSSMWEQQRAYMDLLVERRGFPCFPLLISTKSNQGFIRGIVHHCQDELFEATRELKNAKGHRATEISDFDRDKYLEELIDAQHLLLEVAILSGISRDEFVAAYLRKGGINRQRILDGY